MKLFALSFLFLLLDCGVFAKQTATPSKHVRVEVLITKTVVFIREQVDLNGKPVSLQGTGFLVAVPDQRLKGDQGFIYLITNRHVAQAMEDVNGTCQTHRILSTSFTWNLRSPPKGDREYTETIPNPPGVPWVFPSDDSVDLAAVPIAANPNKYDVEFVTLSDFITPDLLQREFSLGDKILFAGLFPPFEGATEIQPILRQGMLSMIPDGPIPGTLCRAATVYLADVHAVGGNSGSPVFITPRFTLGGRVNIKGAVPYDLLGVISGYMCESENLELRASTSTLRGSLKANAGISVIVPATELKNLLESAPLQKMRDQVVATRNSKKEPKPRDPKHNP